MKNIDDVMEQFDEEYGSSDGQDFIGTVRISDLKSFLRAAISEAFAAVNPKTFSCLGDDCRGYDRALNKFTQNCAEFLKPKP